MSCATVGATLRAAVLTLCILSWAQARNYIIQATQTDATLLKSSHALGEKMMWDLCGALDDASVFKCLRVWRNGAVGRSETGQKDRILGAIGRLVIEKRLPGASTLQFTFAEDTRLIHSKGYNSPTKPRAKPLPSRAQQIATNVINKSRKMLAGWYAPTTTKLDWLAGHEVTVQEDALEPLSFLSAFAENCTNQPVNNFRYTSTGKGVKIYIVDQAVQDHEEFDNFWGGGSRIVDRYYSPSALANKGQPCAAWHATHVAALAAGLSFGAAKDAQIISVAVLPGCESDGNVNDLIAGLQWVAQHIEKYPGPAVVSMSLEVPQSDVAQAISDQVAELLAMSVSVVSAAGNDHDDACYYIPANIPGVVTVAGAQLVDTGDGRPPASAVPYSSTNTGTCVTVWAPGYQIVSASPENRNAIQTLTGTSQAAPMVTGIMAQFLERFPDASPPVVMQSIKDNAYYNALLYPSVNTVSAFAQVNLW